MQRRARTSAWIMSCVPRRQALINESNFPRPSFAVPAPKYTDGGRRFRLLIPLCIRADLKVEPHFVGRPEAEPFI